jgi:hypothetical protein
VLILAFFVFFVFAKPAFAYIDPGSGTMILQGILLAFVAGWFAIKNYWLRILGLFKGEATGDTGSETPGETDRNS